MCLSPPPPPAGPLPIPYPNKVSASDLADGSKTVKIDGEPTALEDASYCSTSSGDEGGTQGGGVVSHKTKGTACFTFWSLMSRSKAKESTVIEDPMLQNCGSQTPPNGLTPAARSKSRCGQRSCERGHQTLLSGQRRKRRALQTIELDQSEFDRETKGGSQHVDNTGTDTILLGMREHQSARVENATEAGTAAGTGKPNPAKGRRFVADHDPPLIVRHYSGGCWMSKAEKRKDAESLTGVVAHCTKCSGKQGNALGSKGHHPVLKKAHGCK